MRDRSDNPLHHELTLCYGAISHSNQTERGNLSCLFMCYSLGLSASSHMQDSTHNGMCFPLRHEAVAE